MFQASRNSEIILFRIEPATIATLGRSANHCAVLSHKYKQSKKLLSIKPTPKTKPSGQVLIIYNLADFDRLYKLK